MLFQHPITWVPTLSAAMADTGTGDGGTKENVEIHMSPGRNEGSFNWGQVIVTKGTSGNLS